MGETELTKFTGGLVLKPTDDDLQIHQVQQAENVDFVREPGAVRPRRGINKHLSTEFSSDNDIFWARALATDVMMVRSGVELYKDENKLNLEVTQAPMRFTEFADHVIMANGTDTLKYKDTGMSLSWNTAYSQFWEAVHIDATTMYAAVLPFELAVVTGDDYFCSHNWEVEQAEGASISQTSVGLYTSSCYIGFTNTIADAATVLHLHCDGSDGGTTFTDSSKSVHVPTANGAATTNTANKKFGTASLLLPGGADYITIPDSTDFDFGSNPFTIDFQLYPEEDTDYGALYEQYVGASNRIVIRYVSSGRVWFLVSGMVNLISTVDDLTLNEWNHVAIIRGWGGSASSWAITINGTVSKTTSQVASMPALAADILIGKNANASTYFKGRVDEFRVTKGTARWTANFTAPTAAYGVPSSTIVAKDFNVPVDLGLTAPSSALTATDAGSGAGPDGTYTYKVTYYNNDGFESDVSAASTAETVVDNDIDLTAIPISPDPQVVGRKIYRIEDGGTTYKLVTTIENNYETTYTDSVADLDLGADAPTSHSPPPAFSEVHSHKSLLWGVDAANKNKAFYCTSFDQWEYFVSTNYEAFGSQSDEIQTLETLAEFLVPVQKTKIWKLNTEEAVWEIAESLSKRGTPSPDAAVTIGDALLVVDGTGIYYFDTIKDIIFSQVIEPIFDAGGEYGERINSSYYDDLAVGFLDEVLYISYTRNGQALNDRTVIYHRESKTFQGVITQGFSSFTVDREAKAIYGAGTDGYVYRLDNGTTDEGSASISWSFTTKDLDKELVTQSYELTGGKLTAKGIGKLVYKRAGKIRLDIDPSGEEVTVAVYLDGTSRQSRVYDDAARVVKEIILDPDYDFYRLALKFSGSTDSLVKVHSVRVTAEELT